MKTIKCPACGKLSIPYYPPHTRQPFCYRCAKMRGYGLPPSQFLDFLRLVITTPTRLTVETRTNYWVTLPPTGAKNHAHIDPGHKMDTPASGVGGIE